MLGKDGVDVLVISVNVGSHVTQCIKEEEQLLLSALEKGRVVA